MELRPKDNYRVECADLISQNAITSLMSLYQPLIGMEGVCLYLTLMSEGRTQKTQENHLRLCELTGMNIDTLERARIKLEEFLLVRTYVQEEELRSSYVYLLHMPLSVQGFLNSREFMNLYAHAVGVKQAQQTVTKLTAGAVSLSGYRDVTRSVVHAADVPAFDVSVEYSRIEPRYNFSNDDVAINFDYEHFIATTSALVFPAELRTQENLRLIGKLATVYGLSADRMRVLVSRCVSLSTMSFDAEKLKVMAARCKPDITQADDPYSLPPVSFLQAKQNGADVSMSDKRMLERLAMNMHFPPDVINILIEYVLRVSQNRLIPAFVDSVAGEWARDGVKNREQAIAEAKKKYRTVPHHHDVMPAYYEEMKNQPAGSQQKASEQQISEVKNLLKEMGNGNHAKG